MKKKYKIVMLVAGLIIAVFAISITIKHQETSRHEEARIKAELELKAILHARGDK